MRDVQIGNMPLPRGMGYGMDTSLIENIEIVKGPIGSISGGQTSTLGAYGAGGSINLILKAPDFEEKQRNVSLLSVYSSPDGGSRNDVQIAAFCDNTARTVKSPAFL